MNSRKSKVVAAMKSTDKFKRIPLSTLEQMLQYAGRDAGHQIRVGPAVADHLAKVSVKPKDGGKPVNSSADERTQSQGVHLL